MSTKKIADDFLIRSPEQEYELYVTQQIENAERFGEADKKDLYNEALHFGLKVLKDLKQ